LLNLWAIFLGIAYLQPHLDVWRAAPDKYCIIVMVCLNLSGTGGSSVNRCQFNVSVLTAGM
jgi:hypothetical protein